jgi:hypothetical protein
MKKLVFILLLLIFSETIFCAFGFMQKETLCIDSEKTLGDYVVMKKSDGTIYILDGKEGMNNGGLTIRRYIGKERTSENSILDIKVSEIEFFNFYLLITVIMASKDEAACMDWRNKILTQDEWNKNMPKCIKYALDTQALTNDTRDYILHFPKELHKLWKELPNKYKRIN